MGLSTPWIAIIGVFAGGAVFLVCDVILFIFLLVHRRRRGDTDSETGSEKYLHYPHYKRIPSQQLQTSVLPGRYTAPLTVQLEECPLTSCCKSKEVDILVDIQRGPLRPSVTSPTPASPHAGGPYDGRDVLPDGAPRDPSSASLPPPPPVPRPAGELRRGEVELLGWDPYFHDTFALHPPGSCLHFLEAGTYKVQAYTVCRARKEVSMVHQWMFDVVSPFPHPGPRVPEGGTRHASHGRSAPRTTSRKRWGDAVESEDGSESERGAAHGGRGHTESRRRRHPHRKHGGGEGSRSSSTISTSASFSPTDSSSTYTNASPFSPAGSANGHHGYRTPHDPPRRRHSHRHGASHSISPSALPKRKLLWSTTPSYAFLPSPRIVPAGGSITSGTAVHLHPTHTGGEGSSSAAEEVEVRYSTDGSYPSLRYTGPFVLSGGGGGGGVLPPPPPSSSWGTDGAKMVLVKAVALRKRTRPSASSRDGKKEEWMQSEVTQATFHVTNAPTAFLDPSLPSPSLRVRALDAKLYFDLTAITNAWERKKRHVPLLSGGGGGGVVVRIFYQCHAIDAATRPDGPPPLTAGNAQLYAGVSVSLPSHLTRVYAWTVVEGVGYSAPSVYEPGMEVFLLPYEEEGGVQERCGGRREGGDGAGVFPFSSSSPTPPPSGPFLLPPCPENRGRTGIALPPSPSFPLQPPPLPPASSLGLSPSSPPAGGSSPSASFPTPLPPRGLAMSPSPAAILASAPFLRPEIPSPVMCVSCKELEFSFADPPAHTRVAYTLNRTEPTLTDVFPPACAALSTTVFEPSLSPPYTPAGGVGMPWRGAREEEEQRQKNMRCGREIPAPGGSSSTMGALWPSDLDGLHTFLYESGRWIRVSLLEPDGLHVTARICKPVFSSGGSTSLCRGHGCGWSDDPSSYGYRSTTPPAEADTVLTTAVGTLLGYRLSAAFHRGFYYLEK